jgi:hypothetical protein
MRRITNQKDLIKNIIQECDCPFFSSVLPRPGTRPDKRNRSPDLALYGGGSLDREPQGNIGRGLALKTR